MPLLLLDVIFASLGLVLRPGNYLVRARDALIRITVARRELRAVELYAKLAQTYHDDVPR